MLLDVSFTEKLVWQIRYEDFSLIRLKEKS